MTQKRENNRNRGRDTTRGGRENRRGGRKYMERVGESIEGEGGVHEIKKTHLQQIP